MDCVVASYTSVFRWMGDSVPPDGAGGGGAAAAVGPSPELESISLREAMFLDVPATNTGHVCSPDGPEGSCELSSVLQVASKKSVAAPSTWRAAFTQVEREIDTLRCSLPLRCRLLSR